MGILNVFDQHINSADDESDTVVGKTGAIIIGIVAGLIALSIIGWTAWAAVGVFVKLLPLLGALYVTFGVLQFWISRAYRDGITVNEAIDAAIWPKDVYEKVKAGNKLRDAASGSINTSAGTRVDNSTTIIPTTLLGAAVGFVVSLAVLWFDLWVLGGLVGLVFQAILVVAAIWSIGAVVTYWASRVYEDGLTINEIKTSALWPVEILKVGYRAAKAVV